MKDQCEMVLDKFHYIHWAPRSCGGSRGDQLLCAVVWCCVQQYWLDLGTSVLGHGVSFHKESESVSVSVNIPGLNSCAHSTLFLAWPRETPRRRQVGLVEQWKCLSLCLCWFPISSRYWFRCPAVVGSLSDLSCKQISPSQVSSGAKISFYKH